MQFHTYSSAQAGHTEGLVQLEMPAQNAVVKMLLAATSRRPPAVRGGERGGDEEGQPKQKKLQRRETPESHQLSIGQLPGAANCKEVWREAAARGAATMATRLYFLKFDACGSRLSGSSIWGLELS